MVASGPVVVQWVGDAGQTTTQFITELPTNGNFSQLIVIIRNWLGKPANFKVTNKDQKIYVGRSRVFFLQIFYKSNRGLYVVKFKQ